MAKKTLKRKHTVKQVEKPSSIFFADYSNSKPDHITPVARPMFLAPEYDANAVLRTAGTNVMDVKLTPEEEKKLKKIFKKIDYSKITDKGQIIDTAIDQILGAEDDPNKRNQLQTLLRMTNYMENKYGASDDAWNNKKTNFGFVELDKVAINDLFTPGGANGNFTKGQKNAFQYLKNFGLPTDQKELEKLLLNNDPLANMAVSRLVYASNPKPLPDMNDQKAVFNYWLNDYNHRGALKHQTEEDLFNIFQEGYKTYNAPSYKPKITITPEGHAVIDDNRGQWAYPGEVTRINASAITMAGVPYPVLGVGADGEQQMMYPNEEYAFNEAPVTEYPMMEAKRGGVTWLNEYAEGGKTFSSGGEKHRVYRKESPTGNGEGVKGHIMVTHPTMDKGEWDTIDLTEKSGAKTIAQGVAATRKWHRENPEYEEGGPINSAENPESLPQVNIQGTVPDWAKDRKKYGKDEIHFWESFNPKKWGLNDYSDYSSFNSAFRNASESNENEFVYKGKRYNTQRVNQEASDAYNNQKQWLSDYIKTNTPNPLLDSKQKEEYYKNYVSQVSPEGTNDNNKELVQVDNFTNYTRDQKVQQQLEKLNTPYYFSITNQKPEDMTADGYMNSQNKKIFFNTNPEGMPEGFNTAYLHELSHKSENSDDVLHTVPIVDVDLMKKTNSGNYVRGWDQKTFDYVSEPTEVQARKMSTLYYLDQNKLLNRDENGKINVTEEQLNNLYNTYNKNRKGVPYDIGQLLDLYNNQKGDLLNYLNNDFSKYKNRWNTPDKKKYGGKINGYQIGGTVNLASPEYAEYQFFQSLQSSPTNIAPQQIAIEEPEIQTAPVSEKRMKGYNETLLTKLKELIDPESAKDFEGTTSDDLLQLGTRGRQRGLTRASIFDKPEDIDFSELDRQQRPTSKQEQTTRQTSSYTKEEPLPQGTPAISNPLGRKAYAALVKELRKDPSTADDALNIAKLLLAQSAQETGQWTSPAALQAGNLSGIKFYNQKGRRPSSVLAPASEENGYRRPYVQYDSPEDWASSMIQLMKGRYKDALYSKTPEEYAARLRARGYYTGSQDVYAKNMRAFFRQFKFE